MQILETLYRNCFKVFGSHLPRNVKRLAIQIILFTCPFRAEIAGGGCVGSRKCRSRLYVSRFGREKRRRDTGARRSPPPYPRRPSSPLRPIVRRHFSSSIPFYGKIFINNIVQCHHVTCKCLHYVLNNITWPLQFI